MRSFYTFMLAAVFITLFAMGMQCDDLNGSRNRGRRERQRERRYQRRLRHGRTGRRGRHLTLTTNEPIVTTEEWERRNEDSPQRQQFDQQENPSKFTLEDLMPDGEGPVVQADRSTNNSSQSEVLHHPSDNSREYNNTDLSGSSLNNTDSEGNSSSNNPEPEPTLSPMVYRHRER